MKSTKWTDLFCIFILHKVYLHVKTQFAYIADQIAL